MHIRPGREKLSAGLIADLRVLRVTEQARTPDPVVGRAQHRPLQAAWIDNAATTLGI